MTDDELIEWLLHWGRIGEAPVLIEAASRIKKLKAALAKIAQHDMQAIAMDALCPGERIRKALEGKDE